MTLNHIFGWLLVGFMFGAITMSARSFVAQCRVERDRLVRLGLIETGPRASRVNQIRRDPSPRPKDAA